MKRLVLLVFAFALLGGCTSVQYNGGKEFVRNLDEPPVGAVATAFVGEKMLSKGVIYEQMVLKVNRHVEGFAYQIPAAEYPQVGHDHKQDFYSVVGVGKNPFADPISALSVSRTPNAELCVITTFGTSTCYNADFSRERMTSVSKSSLQQTLLYGGRIGDRINIAYREFKESMARPAFNHEAEYDLSESRVIGYRGASLEVIEADNNHIKYRVLRNFR